MKTLARIIGGLLWITVAFMPLLGQWLYHYGPEWIQGVNDKGAPILGIGTALTLAFTAVLLFVCGFACFVAADSYGDKK